MKKPLVSVCIPVYGTENVLRKCLDSVAMQDFAEKEIVVVSDASCGLNEKGEDAKKIVKKFAKETKVPVVFKEHLNNLGILETRRDLLSFSSGEFIFYIDSDDYLEGANAISFLYNEAKRTGAEIVNSTAVAVTENPEKNGEQQRHLQEKIGKITLGALEAGQIADDCFVSCNHCGFLWGKLIKRSLMEKAFSFIPFTECTMAEDLCLYFFVSVFARKYFGVQERFYRYSVDSGISSAQMITDIERWRRVCSAASAFVPVVQFIQSPDGASLSKPLVDSMKAACNNFVANNLKQLEQRVSPELKEQAYSLLCEYWGEDYVKTIERAIEKRK